MKHNQYFGTDGIRGKVGEIPITPEFFLKLGWAAGKVLANNGSRQILLGKDTRISGAMLQSALAAGLAAAGISVVFTGLMPTPAIAYLTSTFRADAGIIISASHNKFDDNGIKLFSREGMKLSEDLEKHIEAKLEKYLTCVATAKLGKTSYIGDTAAKSYIEFCKGTISNNIKLNGLKIVVDCANGATYNIAPSVLYELGAEVVAIGCQPDGLNINKECGTTDIRLLQRRVLVEKADLGIAYDGDGDRVMMVDHVGKKVDGDQMIYVIAREQQRKGKLVGGVVGTIMSNMGLELALKQLDIPFIRTQVGDRYVVETLQKNDWRLGAETSGHLIIRDHTTTGDGMIAGIQVLSAIVDNNMKLHELCSDMHCFPQRWESVYFVGKQNPLDSGVVKKAIAKVQQQLAGGGRVVLRKSGTEPLIRIMVEGKDINKINKLATYLKKVVKAANNN